MPPALNTQTVVAFIWDFDKTLSPGYMQDPLFAEFGTNAQTFWSEVNGLVARYEARGLKVAKDTAYLGHILTYVRHGLFAGLTNERLRELGAHIELAPGIPEFFQLSRDLVANDARYAHHSLTVEHYVVSTGLRQMIEGSAVAPVVDGVWACELLSTPPAPGFADQPLELDGELSQIGYTIDNTTKTRAVFEINKGVNIEPGIDVNARMDEDDRRVPFRNMIYVADGPSDVPVFSVVQAQGGKTFGVYTLGAASNYEGVRALQDDGRIQGMGEADYRENSPAYLWLMSSLRQIANEICDRRERSVGLIAGPAGHAV